LMWEQTSAASRRRGGWSSARRLQWMARWCGAASTVGPGAGSIMAACYRRFSHDSALLVYMASRF